MTLKCVVKILFMLAGNIQPNPGPFDIKCLLTPADFLNRLGLGFVHLNVQSLVPKIWAQTTDTDFIALTETCLRKSVSDNEITVSGYNVFRANR